VSEWLEQVLRLKYNKDCSNALKEDVIAAVNDIIWSGD